MRPSGATALFAALAAFAVVHGCLPSLDASKLLPACAGGVANGQLDEGEECDDGNTKDGDGCSARCFMECPAPGVLWRHANGGNDHCYTPLSPIASFTGARDQCGVLGGHLVTVRSAEERDFITANVLAGAPEEATFHTAYLLDSVDVTFGCPNPSPPLPAMTPKPVSQCTVREAIADPAILLREPGILAGYVAGKTPLGVTYGDSPQNACSGCYAGGLEGEWWTAPNDRLVLDRSGNLVALAPGVTATGAICERAPIGDPASCDGPSCAPGANTERRWNGHRYAYFSVQKSFADAEADCAKLTPPGHLLYVESEAEREAVFRFFRNELTTATAWLGLAAAPSGPWTWSDGVADGADRPSVWAIGPFACSATSASCCAVISLGPGSTGTYNFAEGLARRALCTQTNPFLCKLPAP